MAVTTKERPLVDFSKTSIPKSADDISARYEFLSQSGADIILSPSDFAQMVVARRSGDCLPDDFNSSTRSQAIHLANHSGILLQEADIRLYGNFREKMPSSSEVVTDSIRPWQVSDQVLMAAVLSASDSHPHRFDQFIDSYPIIFRKSA